MPGKREHLHSLNRETCDMPSDIEIAQNARMQRIIPLIEGRLGIPDEDLEPYGHYKAKVSLDYIDTLQDGRTASWSW